MRVASEHQVCSEARMAACPAHTRLGVSLDAIVYFLSTLWLLILPFSLFLDLKHQQSN